MNTYKPRVALFLPGLYEGGAERVILNLATAIAARNYPVDLVLARAEGPYMPQVPASVRLIDLNVPRVLGSVPALTRYLRREQPAALLSALFTNLIALWARRLGGVPQRLVISEHNTLSSVVSNQGELIWQWYPKLAGWFYPWADCIVAVSNGIADDLARTTTIPRERIQVVYNPVITSDLLQKSQQPVDHPWFNSSEVPVIVAAGRLMPQKGFDTLLRAFSLLRKDRPARLLIMGEGDLRPSLESLTRELGMQEDVSLAGFVQNPYPYMARAAAFALSSRWEGLPTVLIEALYLGTPIVATDCAAGTREILRNGRYGRMVPVDAPFELSEALKETLDTPSSPPPADSWQAFVSDTAVDRYLSLLVGA
jgi:glycosyltransferase involved in cell wall biosynthesis